MKKILLGLVLPLFLISCSQNKTQEPKDPLLVEAKNNFYGGDYKAAAKDLHVLSKAGDPEAQYALGYMYYYGMGVDKNQIVARRLISMSAEKGNKEAIRALRLLVDSNSVFANVENVPPRVQYGANTNKFSEPSSKTNVSMADNQAKTSPVADEEFKELTKKDMENTFKLVKFDKDKPVTNVNKTAKATVNKPNMQQKQAVNNWLFKESPQAYTIQLAANKDKNIINDFIKKHNIAKKAKIYTYNYNNEQWYAVSLGVYNEPAAAFNVLTKLPQGLKANKPWVRQLSNIKKEALALRNIPTSNIG